ncbi:MAG: dimethylamine monooxygenase subunit DmmA family protein [Sneathiella sp.]
MPKTVFEPSIKSRPVYGELSREVGKAHLMIADAEGAEAILNVLSDAPSEFLAITHIIYIPKRSEEKYIANLQSMAAAQLYIGPSYEASAQRLRHTLEEEHMGLQVYLAGTEGLIGQAMREAISAGIPHSAIQTEHRGSTARRMQCVHCKGITEDVTKDPFICSHCGLSLFVRDHYSRRLAAYQAVRIDAEDPGNIPESVERFK